MNDQAFEKLKKQPNVQPKKLKRKVGYETDGIRGEDMPDNAMKRLRIGEQKDSMATD